MLTSESIYRDKSVLSVSHLILLSSVTLSLELINNLKWCQINRKRESVSLLSFQESTKFLKIMDLITQIRGGLPFTHGTCILQTLQINIRQKGQEGENYWGKYCSVNCVLAWVGHNFWKERDTCTAAIEMQLDLYILCFSTFLL